MKLKYKKMIIIITVAALLLSFFILTLIPTGGSNGNPAQDAELSVNQNENINKLITDYFTAKKTVNMEALTSLVSDVNQIDREKLTAMAAYVEDYQNLNCYVIKSEDSDAYRVYVKYDIKLKNIDTLGPGLSAFYVTGTSDGGYAIYLSALDQNQEEFITAADKNQQIIDLKEEVADNLQKAIDQDASFKQFYEKMEKEIQAASVSGAAAE